MYCPLCLISFLNNIFKVHPILLKTHEIFYVEKKKKKTSLNLEEAAFCEIVNVNYYY